MCLVAPRADQVDGASRTVRLSGPMSEMSAKGTGDEKGTRPWLGFRPNTPQKLAGMRMEPAAPMPKRMTPRVSAAAAAAPAEEPPVVTSVFHGLRVIP